MRGRVPAWKRSETQRRHEDDNGGAEGPPGRRELRWNPQNGPTVHALLSSSEYDRATGSNDYQAKPTVEEITLMGKINRLSTGHSEAAFRARNAPPYLRVPILEYAWRIMR